MSREIKFRAWGKNIEKYMSQSFDGEVEIANVTRILGDLIDQGSWVIEQYTGLKDKKGKEIYEGDIVKFGYGDQTPAEVVYQDGSYFIKALDDGTLFYDPEANKPCPFGWFETYGLEVIGNVHENPELLGDEE